tara:strand:- start:41 stop:538 length:498 start_codon:yes stop_codon:yes gene_type:complete
LKTSEETRDWNSWIETNYEKLVSSAKGMHPDPYDLVHHTYLRILRLEGVKIDKVMENPFGYFNRAMWVEATRGRFMKEYELKELPLPKLVATYDLSKAFLLENFYLATERLSWFDMTVLNLYCDGYNMAQVAEESGIKKSTFYTSLHRSKIRLKEYFSSSISKLH